MICVRPSAAEWLVPLHSNGHDRIHRNGNTLIIIDARPGVEIVHSANPFKRRLAIALRRENFDAEDFTAIVKRGFNTLTT